MHVCERKWENGIKEKSINVGGVKPFGRGEFWMNDIRDINTELRYITLELMKIAEKRKVPFKKVAAEFVENATTLHELIQKFGR